MTPDLYQYGLQGTEIKAFKITCHSFITVGGIRSLKTSRHVCSVACKEAQRSYTSP